MKNEKTLFQLVAFLTGLALACSAVPGLSIATPTLWVVVPLASAPAQPISSPVSIPGTPAATNAPVDQKEISILKCQNNPGTGIVPVGTSVILVWGWATDNASKRDEIISISSFTLVIDGVSQNTGTAALEYVSDNTVFWKASVGVLPAGTHEVILTRILSRNFSESSGSLNAGPQTAEVCELIVQG